MLEQFKEMKVIWSGLSQDIMEFLSDRNCALIYILMAQRITY
jgi:hypothetical protein